MTLYCLTVSPWPSPCIEVIQYMQYELRRMRSPSRARDGSHSLSTSALRAIVTVRSNNSPPTFAGECSHINSFDISDEVFTGTSIFTGRYLAATMSWTILHSLGLGLYDTCLACCTIYSTIVPHIYLLWPALRAGSTRLAWSVLVDPPGLSF